MTITQFDFDDGVTHARSLIESRRSQASCPLLLHAMRRQPFPHQTTGCVAAELIFGGGCFARGMTRLAWRDLCGLQAGSLGSLNRRRFAERFNLRGGSSAGGSKVFGVCSGAKSRECGTQWRGKWRSLCCGGTVRVRSSIHFCDASFRVENTLARHSESCHKRPIFPHEYDLRQKERCGPERNTSGPGYVLP